jgi:hypothetical protein
MSTSTATSDPNPQNTIASTSLSGGGSSIEGVDRNNEMIKDRSSRHDGSSSDIPSRHLASSSPESVFISIESMGKISYQRMYRGDGITYPLNLAIINVEKGKVNSVIWSDTCKWCEDDHCVDNTYDYYGNLIESENRVCFLDDSDCTPANSLPETVTDDNPPELVDAITNSLCELHVRKFYLCYLLILYTYYCDDDDDDDDDDDNNNNNNNNNNNMNSSLCPYLLKYVYLFK